MCREGVWVESGLERKENLFDDTWVSAFVPRKAQEGCLGGGHSAGCAFGHAAGSELRLSRVPFSLWCLMTHWTQSCGTNGPYGSKASGSVSH